MNKLKDFFYYTRSERNGVLLLLASLIVLFFLPFGYRFWLKPSVVSFGEWQADVAAFEAGLSPKETSDGYKKSNQQGVELAEEKALVPQNFDPNTATEEIFQKMGLPERTIKSILNYRSKGGKFKTKESLQKIYTLSEAHYQQLLPFVQLETEAVLVAKGTYNEVNVAKPLPIPFNFDPNTSTAEEFEALGLGVQTIRSILNYREKGGQFRQKEDFKKIYNLPDSVYQHLATSIQIVAVPTTNTNKVPFVAKSYYKIDINKASADDFQQFKGIGVSYANRILKMKEALGGFVSIEQIGELYKLPDSTFQLMLPYLECSKTTIQQLSINTASVEELQAHPYLQWFHAKAIVKYRETEGLWKSVELVQILTEFDDGKGTYKKIKPYLKL